MNNNKYMNSVLCIYNYTHLIKKTEWRCVGVGISQRSHNGEIVVVSDPWRSKQDIGRIFLGVLRRPSFWQNGLFSIPVDYFYILFIVKRLHKLCIN